MYDDNRYSTLDKYYTIHNYKANNKQQNYKYTITP